MCWSCTAQPAWCTEHLIASIIKTGLNVRPQGPLSTVFYGQFFMGALGNYGFTDPENLAFDLQSTTGPCLTQSRLSVSRGICD